VKGGTLPEKEKKKRVFTKVKVPVERQQNTNKPPKTAVKSEWGPVPRSPNGDHGCGENPKPPKNPGLLGQVDRVNGPHGRDRLVASNVKWVFCNCISSLVHWLLCDDGPQSQSGTRVGEEVPGKLRGGFFFGQQQRGFPQTEKGTR